MKCKNCGREFENVLTSCPHCNTPIKEDKKSAPEDSKRIFAITAIIIVSIVFIVSFIACASSETQKTKTTNIKQSESETYDDNNDSELFEDIDEEEETKSKEYYTITTKELYDYYSDYEYEYIKTTVKVTSVSKSGDTCAYTVYDLDDFDSVKIKVTNISTTKTPKKGDYLTVSGLCSYDFTYSDLVIEIDADKINKTSKKLFKSLGSEKRIPKEYKNALEVADSYANNQHMSKARLYRQLTSEYGEKFPAAAAQYAVDNVKTNWKKNALKTGKSYYLNQHMSKDRVYQQLISEYGEQFTPDEAQYAVDHLDD